MTVSLFAALTAHFIIKNEANVAQAISHFINRKREDVIEEAQDIAKKYSVALSNMSWTAWPQLMTGPSRDWSRGFPTS